MFEPLISTLILISFPIATAYLSEYTFILIDKILELLNKRDTNV